MNELTQQELSAVRRAVRGSIDLYARYVMLRSETPAMAQKQQLHRRYLRALRTALPKLVIVMAAALLCSCASSTTPVGRQYAAVNPTDVRVIYQEPHRPYEVIALLSRTRSILTSVQETTKDVREEAARNGADAVLITDAFPGYFGRAGTEVHGKAIRWQ
jgi:hypothetical protein